MGDIRLVKGCAADGARAYRRLEEAFPPSERREEGAFCRLLAAEPCFSLFFAFDGEREIGLISLWEMDGFAFVEHLVVYPEHRGGGYGGKIVRAVFRFHPALVLEIEPPDEGDRPRRGDFYRRPRFCMNGGPYFQAPYPAGRGGLPMRLLSYPAPLQDPQKTVAVLREKVYAAAP